MKKRRLLIIYVVFIAGSIGILLAPWLVRYYFKINEFSESGPLGDTIGGITAPLTGLLGAFLVFQALLAQIDANKLITDQFTEQKILNIVIEQLKILRDEIKDFKVVTEYWSEEGAGAIEAVLNGISTRHIDPFRTQGNPSLYVSRQREIVFFMEGIDYLISLVNETSLKPKDKSNLLGIICETYNSKLRDQLIKNEYKRESKQALCNECGKTHGISEDIYTLFDKVERGIVTTK